MKKLTAMIMCLLALTLVGCSTFFDNPETAYDVGSKVTAAYVVGRPFIPAEERAVIKEIYMVVRDADSIGDVTAELINNLVALNGSDLDEPTQQAMAALFIEARGDLLSFITEGTTPEEELAIKTAFFRGVEDKLKVHNISVTREQDQATLLELIDSMGT